MGARRASFFDGQDWGIVAARRLGGAEAGADFEDAGAGADVGEGDDAAELIAVVKEILTEGPG